MNRPEQALLLKNTQRTKTINLRLLREIIEWLMHQMLLVKSYDLTINLIAEKKMTELNETVLQHAGSTDVITFDYSVDGPSPMLAGEIFVCVDEALLQARRFHVTWQSELVRYVVHGVLHLQGFDDLKPAARRKMKVRENRLVRDLGKQFPLSKIANKSKVNG